jgi:hypothetical protein
VGDGLQATGCSLQVLSGVWIRAAHELKPDRPAAGSLQPAALPWLVSPQNRVDAPSTRRRGGAYWLAVP